MSRPRLRRSPLRATALLACTGVLAACGQGSGEAGEPVSYLAEFALGGDTPEAREFVLVPVARRAGGTAFDLSVNPAVAWVNEGQYLGVVSYGSGSCPSGPHDIAVVAEQEIEIRLGPLFAERDPCSADVSPHVTVVELPQGITPTRALTARFTEHELTIPAVGR